MSDALAMRKSEAYLNYAEACAMQSGKESQACSALNQLRLQRVEGYVEQNYTGEELAREIANERRKELCFEGQRGSTCVVMRFARNILLRRMCYMCSTNIPTMVSSCVHIFIS